MAKPTDRECVEIIITEIGAAIGIARLREFERKVRRMFRDQGGRSGRDWITAIAAVIVDDDDRRADAGFQRGMRRIRSLSETVQ